MTTSQKEKLTECSKKPGVQPLISKLQKEWEKGYSTAKQCLSTNTTLLRILKREATENEDWSKVFDCLQSTMDAAENLFNLIKDCDKIKNCPKKQELDNSEKKVKQAVASMLPSMKSCLQS